MRDQPRSRSVMRFGGLGLGLLGLALPGLCACSTRKNPQPRPGPSASAMASTSASASAAPSAAPTSEVDASGKRPLPDGFSVKKVSLVDARAVLYETGWGRTGGSQSDDGFRLQKMRSDGMKVVVTRHRFDSDAVRRMRLPTISKDAVWVQEGDEVLAAQVTHRAGAVRKEEAGALLDALLQKGADDTPHWREVDAPEGRPTMARTETADGKIRIATSVIDAIVKGLKASLEHPDAELAHHSDRPVDDKRQMPITATIKAPKSNLELLLHCAQKGDSLVPKPDLAGVGGAIALTEGEEICALVVWSGRDGKTPSDPDASEALLKKLLGI